jgi:SAM-dependent methyltransferase
LQLFSKTKIHPQGSIIKGILSENLYRRHRFSTGRETVNIAFITNPAVQCGASQLGMDIVNALREHSRHAITAYPIGCPADFDAAFDSVAGSDLALYNYHPGTIGFLKREDIRRTGKPAVGLLHEFDYLNVHAVLADIFRYRIAPDPSLAGRVPGLWSVPRVIPPVRVEEPKNELFTIGTFGFATPGKNYDEIIAFAARHFDRARVRLHLPNSFYCDADGSLARQVCERCRAMTDGRIELQFSGDYLAADDLIAFLAGNDFNLFLYDTQRGRGISSVTDFAVAAERPLALSDSGMFRHIRAFAPELFLSVSSVEHILDNGAQACRRLKALWTPERAARAYDEAFEAAVSDCAKPHAQRLNTVLTEDFREALRPREDEMTALCPEIIARKAQRANVQQAFVLDRVLAGAKPGTSILCVGFNEDTAYYALQAKGVAVDAVDPVFNTDLSGFWRQYHGKRHYDLIFSTSVIEHVEDDETFVSQIAELLAPGGTAVLTMDFREDYRRGDAVPAADKRLYTTERILGRLVPLLHGCRLSDTPDWNEHEPDFDYEGCRYGFATLVFRKESGLPDVLMERREQTLQRMIAEEKLDHARTAQAEAEVERNTATAERRLLALQLENTQQQLTEALARQEAIYASRSWRITKPLRFARLCVRDPHEARHKLKEKIKALPGAHYLLKPYRTLKLLCIDPRAFSHKTKEKLRCLRLRHGLRFGGTDAAGMPAYGAGRAPASRYKDEQAILDGLRRQVGRYVFGKRLDG